MFISPLLGKGNRRFGGCSAHWQGGNA
jgi:hypothetical protein